MYGKHGPVLITWKRGAHGISLRGFTFMCGLAKYRIPRSSVRGMGQKAFILSPLLTHSICSRTASTIPLMPSLPHRLFLPRYSRKGNIYKYFGNKASPQMLVDARAARENSPPTHHLGISPRLLSLSCPLTTGARVFPPLSEIPSGSSSNTLFAGRTPDFTLSWIFKMVRAPLTFKQLFNYFKL